MHARDSPSPRVMGAPGCRYRQARGRLAPGKQSGALACAHGACVRACTRACAAAHLCVAVGLQPHGHGQRQPLPRLQAEGAGHLVCQVAVGGKGFGGEVGEDWHSGLRTGANKRALCRLSRRLKRRQRRHRQKQRRAPAAGRSPRAAAPLTP
jgi:hypothetical protein